MRLISRHNNRFRFFVRYILAGLFGALLNVVVLFVWISLLGLHETYLIGATVGFVVALGVSFILQKLWAFRDRRSEGVTLQFVLYTGVALSGLVLNILLLASARAVFHTVGVDFFNGWYLVVQTGIIAIIALSNFSLNALFTFRTAAKRRSWETEQSKTLSYTSEKKPLQNRGVSLGNE